MIEHIGRRNLATYFESARSLVALRRSPAESGVVESVEESRRQGPTFIRKHVFPDSDLSTISAIVEEAEQVGFELRDFEPSTCVNGWRRLRPIRMKCSSTPMSAATGSGASTWPDWVMPFAKEKSLFTRCS